MDLKHRSIGRSTRAPVADAIVDPDDFIAEIAPFGPVVMVHRHISESTHRGRIHFLYVVRADRCQCSASGGVSGHRAVEPMALQRASLRRWRYQFKEGRSDGKTRRRQFVLVDGNSSMMSKTKSRAQLASPQLRRDSVGVRSSSWMSF